MNKLNKVITLITVLMLSIFLSFALNSSKAFAEEEEKPAGNTQLSVIPSNTDISVSETGEVNISNINSDVSSGMTALLNFIRLLSAVGTIVMLMVFVLNFIKLGTSGTNANARAGAITALVWSGIATACLSMSTVIFFFFFKINNQIVKETPIEGTGGGN